MRRISYVFLTQGRALFSQITLIIFIVEPPKLHIDGQIGVGDSKNVIVFDPVLTGHVIRRMRSGRIRIFNGNQWETLYLINQERIGMGSSNLVASLVTWPAMHCNCSMSKVKVTRARDISGGKNAITSQCIPTSNLVGIINVAVDASGRSVGQTNRK